MNSSTRRKYEIDLRVSQELQNNKDFIYETNQSLQTLRQGILSLSSQFENVISKSMSDHKQLLIEFENLKEWIVDRYKNLNQRLGDAEDRISKVLKSFSELQKEIESEYLTRNEFIEVTDPEMNRVSSLEHNLEKNKDYFNLAVNLVRVQFRDQIEIVRKDLTPIPPAIDPIKQQMDQRFEVFKVDFDGIMREINLLKKAVSYDQKKFENIYTLIERLKEEK